MAGTQAIGHAELFSRRRNVTDIMGRHLESILAQMLDPATATTATGTLEHLDVRCGLCKCHSRRE
jgi:hypothetical protein